MLVVLQAVKVSVTKTSKMCDVFIIRLPVIDDRHLVVSALVGRAVPRLNRARWRYVLGQTPLAGDLVTLPPAKCRVIDFRAVAG